MSEKKTKSTYKRSPNWSRAETSVLIAIWGEEGHQEGLQYNSRVWASISNKFSETFPESPYKTWESLKDRIDYLKRKYREAKKLNNSSGRSRSSSSYYDELDEILGRLTFIPCYLTFLHFPFALSAMFDIVI